MVQDTAWVKWPVISRKVTRGAAARLGCLTRKKLEKSDGILLLVLQFKVKKHNYC